MITAVLDTRDLSRAIGRFPVRWQIAMDDAFDHIKRSFYSRFNKRLEGRPGILSRPRGIRLRFKSRFILNNRNRRVGVEMIFKSKVAVRHEEGAWMTGPNGRRLAVPLSARRAQLYTEGGRLKTKYSYTGRLQGKNDKIRPIELKGQWYLAEVKVRKGADKVTPLFVLKDKAFNPPRLEFYKTWRDFQPRAMEIMKKAKEDAARWFAAVEAG